MRLLLVEDEADLADTLAEGLRREGYLVDVARDGGERRSATSRNGGGYCGWRLRRAQALTGSERVGMASGSQSRRIIPVFLASYRLTRAACARLQDSCSEPRRCQIR